MQKHWCLQLNLKDALTLLPALQKQMDRLLLVDPAVPFVDPNIRYLFALLQRDGMRLYNACNVIIYGSLSKIQEMDRHHTAIFLQCCKNSISLDDRYQVWHKTLQRVRLAQDNLPTFQKLPENIMASQ
eukprot:UN08441